MTTPPGPHDGTTLTVLNHVLDALDQAGEGALDELDRRAADMSPDVRRKVQQALFAVERRRARLDWLVKRFCRRRVRPGLRHILWWGMYQVLWGEALASPVAVDACVRVASARYSRRESGFVNAVLRSVIRALDASGYEKLWQGAPGWVRLDLGEPLWRRWHERFPGDELARLSARLLEPAPIVVRMRAPAELPVTEALGLVALPAPDWAPTARLYICKDAETFFGSQAWRSGTFYVQDPSTLLAPALATVEPGERVADLCAAPGGKALVLGEALRSTGSLICLDRSRRRLARVRENLHGLDVAALLAGDAARPPFGDQVFDAVLLDVPCTNTGVIRRRPDVRWTFSEEKQRELSVLQLRILCGAAPLVRRGGRVVYSTCSIEPDENDDVVNAFLEKHPEFTLGTRRLLMPGDVNDGAFACVLSRQA